MSFDYYKQQFIKFLYEKNKVTDLLAEVETKTQIKREYVALGGLLFLGLYLIFGYGAELICNVIGFVYPAICSIKARENYGNGTVLLAKPLFQIGYSLALVSLGLLRKSMALESKNKDDDTRWLTYWVVFAVFSLVEFFSDILVGWFPFYWFGKCVFLVWCFMPVPWNGSDIIYTKIIRPFFMKHQNEVDQAVSKVSDKLTEIADKAARTAFNGN